MFLDSLNCTVVKNEQIAKNIFDMELKNEFLAKNAKCGQFLHILCGGNTYLRRPISICDVNFDTTRIIYEVKGEGTKELSYKNVGDIINVLGPLGNGFDVKSTYKNAVVIGGGIGTFPLLMVCKNIKAKAILGFRNKSAVVLENDFKNVCENIYITTDDGSYGKKGLVTDYLRELVCDGIDIIYACGPLPMLKAISKIAEKYNIPCQVSLEQRMACGIGACLGCAVKVSTKALKQCSCDDDTKPFTYDHICKNGPVYYANEVIFDD